MAEDPDLEQNIENVSYFSYFFEKSTKKNIILFIALYIPVKNIS